LSEFGLSGDGGRRSEHRVFERALAALLYCRDRRQSYAGFHFARRVA
jgi:hypothetical protein